MGVAYSVGEVDHLYTFFVQWSPHRFTEHRRRRSFLLVDKEKLAVIDSLLSDPDPEHWNVRILSFIIILSLKSSNSTSLYQSSIRSISSRLFLFGSCSAARS